MMAYDKGWAAVNRLIRAGRSFSGREQNCCFLNLGATQFANVSSAVGLNLPDDGRGLALTDWDGDGRVDFWQTNRNGPRVRFLKNEYQTEHDFLALRLTGTHTNRDAIGARVEVHLSGQPQPLIKSIYAGSGYISQSSKWLMFGLGKAVDIDRVIVRWPGGDSEEFAGMVPNHHYQLVEDSGRATPWETPRLGPWKATPAAEPLLPAASRVVLLQPAPLPQQLVCRDLEGVERPIVEHLSGSRGLLINLWATWCPNCLEELAAWSNAQQALSDAKIDVLAICVDEPTGDAAADRRRIGDFAAKRQLPFAVAKGDHDLVEILNVFQRAFIGRQSDLPLPSSVLIDPQGRLAVIYKGPVDAEQVVRDAALMGASTDVIFRGALPFDGQWLERPPTTSARLAAVALIEHGYQQAAEAYARQLLPRYDPTTRDSTFDREQAQQADQEFASLHHLLGAIEFDRQQYQASREHYESALLLDPYNRGLRRELLRTLLRMGQVEPAAAQLEAMLQSHADDPESLTELARIRVQLGQPDAAMDLYESSLSIQPAVEVRFELANLLRDQKRYAEAVEQYRRVLAEVPSPVVLNNLAWLLATASDDRVRNGGEALQLAQRACEVTSNQVPKMLGTLAAAYAEQGDFRSAARVLGQAIALAQAGDADLVPELEQRLRQYENKQPTRD